MVRKKRISFTANGKRVTFLANRRSGSRAGGKTIARRPTSGTRRRNKIGRDAERLFEAGLALAHPAAPVVWAGARLAKDLLG